MPENRPEIPEPLKRQVLIEAGHHPIDSAETRPFRGGRKRCLLVKSKKTSGAFTPPFKKHIARSVGTFGNCTHLHAEQACSGDVICPEPPHMGSVC